MELKELTPEQQTAIKLANELLLEVGLTLLQVGTPKLPQ